MAGRFPDPAAKSLKPPLEREEERCNTKGPWLPISLFKSMKSKPGSPGEGSGQCSPRMHLGISSPFSAKENFPFSFICLVKTSLSPSSLPSLVAGTRFCLCGEGVHRLALEQPVCALSLRFLFSHFMCSLRLLCFLIVPSKMQKQINRKTEGLAFSIRSKCIGAAEMT